jgi:hypothetical protein
LAEVIGGRLDSGVDVGHQHARAVRHQPSGDGQADPSRSSRDDRVPADQPLGGSRFLDGHAILLAPEKSAPDKQRTNPFKYARAVKATP